MLAFAIRCHALRCAINKLRSFAVGHGHLDATRLLLAVGAWVALTNVGGYCAFLARYSGGGGGARGAARARRERVPRERGHEGDDGGGGDEGEVSEHHRGEEGELWRRRQQGSSGAVVGWAVTVRSSRDRARSWGGRVEVMQEIEARS